MTTTKLALGAKLALGLAALAAPSLAWAEDANVAVEIGEAMNKLFGAHAGFRVVHAKGIVVEGSFRGSSEGRALSSAGLFDGSTIPVTVRFSDDKGIPNIPDGSPDANPHGIWQSSSACPTAARPTWSRT